MSQSTEKYPDDSLSTGSVGCSDTDCCPLPSNNDSDSPTVGFPCQREELPKGTKMEAAIRACRDGMPVTLAARQFGVERTTLRYKLKGEHAGVAGYQTRKFSDAEESCFADVLVRLEKMGVPLDKTIFRKVVELTALEKGIPLACMSDMYIRSFHQRHPEITSRIEIIGKERKGDREWTVENCTKWVTTLSDLHAYGYLSDPRGLFSLDESVFPLPENTEKACVPPIAEKDLSHVDGADQEVVTTVFCGRADGKVLRPLLVFPDVQHLPSQIAGTADRCYIASTESRGMDPETFADYVRAEVFPNMQAKKNVIFVDGQFSYLNNLEMLLECAAGSMDIKFVCWPAGQTSYLQSLDVRAFEPVKKRLNEYMPTPSPQVGSRSFALHLVEMLPLFNLETTLVAEFRHAGIFPFDPSEICKSLKTEKIVPDRVPPSVEEIFNRQFADVEAALKEIVTLSPANIEDTMELLKQKAAVSISTEGAHKIESGFRNESPKKPGKRLKHSKKNPKRPRKVPGKITNIAKRKRLQR
ncbi:uncharacterized protein LOC129585620 [Paramacrobiotus metropolitanus]|uniref:uncharacterized protein LOC129585620 n=1 Tax=Paramacrobiotus metropolitanus TaxID=2943436 RepID=UPI002445D8D7|nr:uncharacterized protein LOC129585620 [Paramacrobiotus metropolitanus]